MPARSRTRAGHGTGLLGTSADAGAGPAAGSGDKGAPGGPGAAGAPVAPDAPGAPGAPDAPRPGRRRRAILLLAGAVPVLGSAIATAPSTSWAAGLAWLAEDGGQRPVPAAAGTWILVEPLPPPEFHRHAAVPIRLAIGPGGATSVHVQNAMSTSLDPSALARGRLVAVTGVRTTLMKASPPWDEIERGLVQLLVGGRVVQATTDHLVLATPDGERFRFRRDPADGTAR